MPSSVYIACKSVARVARSASRSAPIVMRKMASERGSIPNNSRQLMFRLVAEHFASAWSVFDGPGRAVEDLLWSFGNCFFTRDAMIAFQAAKTRNSPFAPALDLQL